MSKIVPSLKAILWELCKRFFSSVFSFCKAKGYYYWKHKFCRLCVRNPASRLLQIGQTSEKWQWRWQFTVMTSTSNFFDVVLFLLSSLVLELWQFSFIRDWPEIWKSEIPPSEFCPISGLGQDMDTKFDMNFSNRMLLNAAKFQGYSFYLFWVIKRKQTARGGGGCGW